MKMLKKKDEIMNKGIEIIKAVTKIKELLGDSVVVFVNNCTRTRIKVMENSILRKNK